MAVNPVMWFRVRRCPACRGWFAITVDVLTGNLATCERCNGHGVEVTHIRKREDL